MKIAIMTRGRVGKQTTLKSIPKALLTETWLVVPREEHNKHEHQTIAAPHYVTNYSEKFQWILDGENPILGSDSHCLILDDDLVFSRFNKEGKLLTVRDPEELFDMFHNVELLLGTYPLVGIHPRQHATSTPSGFVKNGRIICAQGINRKLVGKVKVDQFPILADVVLNCTLLARGQENAIITTFFQDHGPCQAPGGCSIYRTPAMQRTAVEYLVGRFPGFVRSVYRIAKQTNWLGEEGRYDYTCQWKRLAAAGAAHVLDPGKVPHPDKEAARILTTVE